MSIPVDLASLADEIARFGGRAFLVSNSSTGPPHVSSVNVAVQGDRLTMRAGRSTRANATERPSVTLIWTAPDVPDYCLIVDGTAREEPPEFVVQPTSAVLHRLATTES